MIATNFSPSNRVLSANISPWIIPRGRSLLDMIGRSLSTSLLKSLSCKDKRINK